MDIRQIVVTALFALLGSFLGLVFTRLYDYIWKPFFVHHNMKHLRKTLGHLKNRYKDVRIQLEGAGVSMQFPMAKGTPLILVNPKVIDWLQMLQSIQGEVIDIERENFQWRADYGVVYSYMFFWKRYSIGYKLVTKNREAKLLLQQSAFKYVASGTEDVED